MGGLDDLDVPAWDCVTIARDDKAGERARHMGLDSGCHCGTRFPGTNDDGAAFRRCGEMGRDAQGRIGRCNCSIEQASQKLPRIVDHMPLFRLTCQLPVKFISIVAEKESGDH